MTRPSADDDHRCLESLERLSRYLDDELAAADRRVIERHLRDCPCCGDVLESLRHTVAICHDEGRPELPPIVRQRARARVSELLSHAPRRRGVDR